MGHVPAGAIPAESSGAHVPGREHRRTGTGYPVLNPRHLALFGESVAAHILIGRGARIIARNLRAGTGELDLVAAVGGRRVAVEVKTIQTGGLDDPNFAFTERKAQRVRTVARRLGIARVDLIAVTVNRSGVAVRWVPEVA